MVGVIKDSLATLSYIVSVIRELPESTYSLSVWNDGISYSSINFETGKVSGTKSQVASCGCCPEYIEVELDWQDLSFEVQLEIFNYLKDKYAKG